MTEQIQMSAVCENCGYRFSARKISPRCYAVLLDALDHRECLRELRLLEMVAEFYRRNPGIEGRIVPDFMRDGPAEEPTPLHRHPDDAEVIAYLKSGCFDLEPRRKFLLERAQQTKGALGKVECPKCKRGQMWLRKLKRAEAVTA